MGFVPTRIYDIAGTLFINALMMICIPLVSSSIITSIVRAREESFGHIGRKMFACYLGTIAIAVFISLVVTNAMPPQPIVSAVDANPSTLALISLGGSLDFFDFFRTIIPSNIFQAFVRGDMLGIVFFSLLFGYAISKIEHPFATTLKNFFSAFDQAMMRMVRIILRCLPLGVFFLIARTFSEIGIHSLHHLGLFSGIVLLGLFVFSCVALPLLLRFVGGVSPIRHCKAMWPALLAAFSTSSSAATIPVALECLEKRAGVSNSIASLVIPLGITFNLAGSALYESTAVLFVAHAYGMHLSLLSQLFVIVLSLVMSIGVAGVPSGSLVAIVAMLKLMGLPIEGIGLFIAVERLLDMFRTAVNIFSDSTCAVLVAKLKGEKEILTKNVVEHR